MALEECYAHGTASQKVQRLGPTILQVALLSQCLQSEEKVEGESEEGWTSGGGTLLVTFLCCWPLGLKDNNPDNTMHWIDHCYSSDKCWIKNKPSTGKCLIQWIASSILWPMMAWCHLAYQSWNQLQTGSQFFFSIFNLNIIIIPGMQTVLRISRTRLRSMKIQKMHCWENSRKRLKDSGLGWQKVCLGLWFWYSLQDSCTLKNQLYRRLLQTKESMGS